MSTSNQSSIVSKCIRIVDLIAESQSRLSFTDIVEKSGFAKSSTHRILSILLSENMIEIDRHSNLYHLGPKITRWTSNSLQNADIQQAANGLLDNLAEVSNNNVALAIPSAEGALILRTSEKYYLSYVPKTGDHSPLHCTALGKVLIAFQPQRQIQETIDKLVLAKFTENTVTSKKALAQELIQIGKQGFACVDGEEFLQVCGIAAPVFDMQGEIAGSVCIWSLKDRASLKDLLLYRPDLIHTCERISTRMGYQALAP